MQGREPPFIDYATFQTRYKPVRKVDDGYLGRITLYRDTKAKLSHWVKEMVFQTKNQFLIDLDSFLKFPINGHSCFVQPYGFSYKTTQSRDSKAEVYTCYYLYEHVEDTFEKVMSTKLKDKNFFHCEEILNLFNHITIACSFLQRSFSFHGDIRPGNIYVTKENTFKLFYTHFRQTSYEQLKTIKTDSGNTTKKKYFLSPELMYLYANYQKNLNHSFVSNLFENINFIKSDVFSLGMIGLICLNYYDFNAIYDWSECKLNYTKINFKLHELDKFHNDLLSNVAWKMLNFSPESRLDFCELEIELSGGDSLIMKNNKFYAQMKFNDGCTELTSVEESDSLQVGSPKKKQQTPDSPKFLNANNARTNRFSSIESDADASGQQKEKMNNSFSKSENLNNLLNNLTLTPTTEKKNISPENKLHNSGSENYGRVTMKPDKDLEESSIFVKKIKKPPTSSVQKNFKNNSEYDSLESNKKQPGQVLNFSMPQKEQQQHYGGNLSDALENHTLKNSQDRGFSQLLDPSIEGIPPDECKLTSSFAVPQNGNTSCYFFINFQLSMIMHHIFKKKNNNIEIIDLVEKRKSCIEKYYKLLFEEIGLKKITKRYLDGSIYEGNMNSKRRDGIGIYFFSNGDVYIGEWKINRIDGKGVYFYANCDVFDGSFQDGEKHGFGTFYYSNGHLFHGEWEKDLKNGKGIYLYCSEQERYEGEWKSNIKEGYGFYYYANGECSEGRWFNNIKQYSKTLDSKDTNMIAITNEEKANIYSYGIKDFYDAPLEKGCFLDYFFEKFGQPADNVASHKSQLNDQFDSNDKFSKNYGEEYENMSNSHMVADEKGNNQKIRGSPDSSKNQSYSDSIENKDNLTGSGRLHNLSERVVKPVAMKKQEKTPIKYKSNAIEIIDESLQN